MNSANILLRRAVIDDLPRLMDLWRWMNFSTEELEKRLTDFQVAVDAEGKLLGAVAFEIAGNQGRIHHEAFEDFSVAEQVRPLFWERIQMLARNNTVFRVWTQETAPFWKEIGLQPASKELLQKFPAKWSNADGGWLALQLKEDAAIQALTGDGEFAALLQADRAATQRTLEKAKMIKQVAMVLAIVLALFVGVLILYAFSRNPGLMDRLHR